MATVYRANQAAIHLSVDGVALDNVVWDKFEGGDKQAGSTAYAPGGMLPVIELGDTPKRSPITLNRGWSDALIRAYKGLDASTGRKSAKVSVTTLNGDGVPTGETVTYSGIVGAVTRPGYDSEGGNAVAMLQVVINPDSELA
jgi:hypothetical protein